MMPSKQMEMSLMTRTQVDGNATLMKAFKESLRD